MTTYKLLQAFVRETHPLTLDVREVWTVPGWHRTRKGFIEDTVAGGCEVLEVRELARNEGGPPRKGTR